MKPLLPFCERIDNNSLGDNIIGFRPGEKWEDAVNRFIIETRTKKINKIINRKGK